MYRLPQSHRDLCRLARWRDLRRILGWILWVGIWLGGALSYNANHQTYPDHRLLKGWRMLLLLLIAAATGFFLFRCWKLFTDRTIEGVITSSGLSHTYAASSDASGLGTDYDFRIHTALKITSANGKSHRLRFEQKKGFYRYYHEGERIVRFRGLPYPLNLDPNASNGYLCVACGFHSEQPIEQCELCHRSIIDPKKLSQ